MLHLRLSFAVFASTVPVLLTSCGPRQSGPELGPGSVTASASSLRTALSAIRPGQTPRRLALPVAARSDEAALLLTQQPELQRFLGGEGRGWTVSFDRRSGQPLLLQGPGIAWVAPGPINISRAARRKLLSDGAAAKANEFLQVRPTLLGTFSGDLSLDARWSGAADADGDLVYATMSRARPRAVMAPDARVTFVVSRGNLVQIHAEHLLAAPPPADPRPVISSQDALSRLRNDLQFTETPVVLGSALQTVRLATTSEAPGVYTGPVGAGYEQHLVHAFRFTVPGKLETYAALVDAYTGETLDAWDDNRYGSVTGGIYPQGHPSTELVVPFVNVAVDNGSAKTTDLGGQYVYESGTATTALAGPSMNLHDACGAPSASATVAPGDIFLGTSVATDCDFSSIGHSTRAGRNAIYHLNNVRQMAAKWLSGVNATSTTWFGTDVVANVNIQDVCNAFWNGNAVNFFRSGSVCANTGEIAGVMHHEWGHGLDQNTKAGSVGDGAKGEAVADTVNLLMSHDQCVGPGFFTVTGNGESVACPTAVRDLAFVVTAANIASACPQSASCAGALGFECHCESHILSGAYWRLSQAYVARYGAVEGWNQFEKGFLRALPNTTAYLRNTAGNGYDAWIAADDDNGDITDGTPNADIVFQAFDAQGIAGTQWPRHAVACTAALNSPGLSAQSAPAAVSLSWTAVPGATSYALFRSQDHNDGQGFLPLANGITGTAFNDQQVDPGFVYTYQVEAVVGTCSSPFGTSASAIPGPRALDDFSLGLSPASSVVTAGSATTVTVVTAVSSGSAQSVSLFVSGLPAGVTGSFSPTSVTAGGSATLTLTAASAAASATATYTVTGTAASGSRATTGTVVVTALPPNVFSLAVSPATISVPAGTSGAVTVSTVLVSGSAQAVSLSVSGLPPGVSGTFSPTSVAAGGSATLTLTAAGSAVAATATYTVTGAAASGSHTASGTIVVTARPPSDFSIAVSPASATVTAGASVAVTVSTAVVSGSTQTVTLSVSGLPAGVTGAFSPATISAGASSTLRLTAASGAAATGATYVVKGTAASGARTASGSLTVIGLLISGVTKTGLAGTLGSQLYFVYPITTAQALLTVHSGKGTGASDLFVQFGTPPTTLSFACHQSALGGNLATCLAARPAVGNWYVMIRGAKAYAGVSLTAVSTPPVRP